jgi:DNA-binding MarR family transcriptional regulator
VRTDAGRTADGDAFGAFVFRTLRLANLLTTAGDELARPAGQSSARWLVLGALRWGPATVADIARTLGLTRQSVQRVADLLARDGLITWTDNPRHRRAKLAVLADPGRSALELIEAGQRIWANHFGGQIGKRDLDVASDVLGQVMAELTRPGDR